MDNASSHPSPPPVRCRHADRNLADLTDRARAILGAVISWPRGHPDHGRTAHAPRTTQRIVAYHEHNETEAADASSNSRRRKSVALVSDAGTPAISDPVSAWSAPCRRRGLPSARAGPSALTGAERERTAHKRISLRRFPASEKCRAPRLSRQYGSSSTPSPFTKAAIASTSSPPKPWRNWSIARGLHREGSHQAPRTFLVARRRRPNAPGDEQPQGRVRRAHRPADLSYSLRNTSSGSAATDGTLLNHENTKDTKNGKDGLPANGANHREAESPQGH